MTTPSRGPGQPTDPGREREAAATSVRPFFRPEAVAVIGASRREGSIGRAIVRNLVQCGFRGPIHPVNPAAKEIEGLPCVASVDQIEGTVDLAIVTVPAAEVESVVQSCAEAGVSAVVVISSGFAEASENGRVAQDRLTRLVRGRGMRLVGPNCMGVLNTNPDVSLNATFSPTWPPSGNVSMLSQSGALGLAMLDHAAQLNIGLGSFVSIGNKADVSGNDLLSYWADDPDTGVIALYLESFGNPRKFARIAPEVAAKKPIVAVKSGRSAAGSRAAASHSAAMASLDVGIDALFGHAGVIRTQTLEELFDVVALLATQPVPKGPRVGVVTNAGGPGILLADACEAHGLSLPDLSDRTLARLREILPPQAGLSNPIDMIASATPEQYAATIEAVGTDPSVDAVVIIYIPPLVTNPEDIAEAVAQAAGTVPADKPVATVFMSSKGAPPLLSKGPRGKLPSYSFPENAANALASAVKYGRWRARPQGHILELAPETVQAIRRIAGDVQANLPDGGGWADPEGAAAILRYAGITLAEQRVVPCDPEQAVEAAAALGLPVVAKAVAPGLIHKTDVGGVVLGLDSQQAVRDAVSSMTRRLKEHGYEPSGVLLQREISGGVEALVGVTSDPSLGPLLVVGLGGIHVELLRDVAFRLTPVSDLEAGEMLDELRAKKLLEGFRGSPPVDRDALIDVIRRISALVEVVPELAELELNPLKVLPRGKGAVAIDARMRFADPTPPAKSS